MDSPKQQGKIKTILLFLLGGLLLAPMLWTHWGPHVGNLATITAHPQTPSVDSEDTQERILLGAALPELPEPRRPCRPGRKLPKLITLQQWISAKQRPRESITLMTQLSADRLSMLENQCRTWPDPILAVIYVPLFRNRTGGPPAVATYQNTTMDDITRGINSFHQFMEGTAQCVLRIELVGQYLNPKDPQQYPINALRNRALTLATTDLVLVLDVDFVASPMLGLPEPGYRDPAVYNQMVELTNRKKALVLPAFEITNRKQDLTMAQNFARSMVIAGKEVVQQSYKEGTLDAFNGRDAPWGHGPTNTTKWVRLSRPILYKVQYEPKYEPFVILSRRLAPWADERFVGYGGNKIAYINQLNGLGFGFHVHPYGFAIHVPHVRTRAANLFVLHKQRGEAEMEALRVEVEAEVNKKTYIPVIKGCRAWLEEEVDEEDTEASVLETIAEEQAQLQDHQHLNGEAEVLADDSEDAGIAEEEDEAATPPVEDEEEETLDEKKSSGSSKEDKDSSSAGSSKKDKAAAADEDAVEDYDYDYHEEEETTKKSSSSSPSRSAKESTKKSAKSADYADYKDYDDEA